MNERQPGSLWPPAPALAEPVQPTPRRSILVGRSLLVAVAFDVFAWAVFHWQFSGVAPASPGEGVVPIGGDFGGDAVGVALLVSSVLCALIGLYETVKSRGVRRGIAAGLWFLSFVLVWGGCLIYVWSLMICSGGPNDFDP